MKHFVLGYSNPSRKGAVTVLYAGDSRAEARTALFSGGEGIALTDYICNPQISQSKRHRAGTAAPQETEEIPSPVEEAPAPEKPKKEKAEKPLALPSKTAPPDPE
jgi:hypothetical protein